MANPVATSVSKASIMSGIARQIAKQQTSGNGNHFKEGAGRIVIKKVFIKEMPQAGLTFVAEHEVLEAHSNGDLTATGQPVQPNAVGSSVSLSRPLTNPKTKNSAMSEVKKYLCAVIGENPETITEDAFADMFEKYVSEDSNTPSLLTGLVVDYETRRHVTVAAKAQATATNTIPAFQVYPMFNHVPEDKGNTVEEIEARRTSILGAEAEG